MTSIKKGDNTSEYDKSFKLEETTRKIHLLRWKISSYSKLELIRERLTIIIGSQGKHLQKLRNNNNIFSRFSYFFGILFFYLY